MGPRPRRCYREVEGGAEPGGAGGVLRCKVQWDRDVLKATRR
jgi:hypothetical protein